MDIGTEHELSSPILTPRRMAQFTTSDDNGVCVPLASLSQPDQTDLPTPNGAEKVPRTITGAYKTTNIQVLEHEASIAPLHLHLEMLAINHVQKITDFTADKALEERCKANGPRAQRRYRTKGNIHARLMIQFRTKIESMQLQSYLAGPGHGPVPDRNGCKKGARRDLESLVD